MILPVLIITLFSYGTPSQKLLELNTFNQIALSFRSITRPASKNEYKDYNLQKSYNPGKKRALA
jgi:hypothetical protein